MSGQPLHPPFKVGVKTSEGKGREGKKSVQLNGQDLKNRLKSKPPGKRCEYHHESRLPPPGHG